MRATDIVLIAIATAAVACAAPTEESDAVDGAGSAQAQSRRDPASPVGDDLTGDGLPDLELRFCTGAPIENTGLDDGRCPAGRQVPLLATGIEGAGHAGPLPQAFFPESAVGGRRLFVSVRVKDAAQPSFHLGTASQLGGRAVYQLAQDRLAVKDIELQRVAIEDGRVVPQAGGIAWRYDGGDAKDPFWPAIFAYGDVPQDAAGFYRVSVTVI